MNTEINNANQHSATAFPLSFADVISAYKNAHNSTCETDSKAFNRTTTQDSNTRDRLIIEFEMAQIYRKDRLGIGAYNLPSKDESSSRNVNFYINATDLEIKPAKDDSDQANFLCNSRFIVAYMKLSNREKEILKLLSTMKTSAEIASAMFISPNTVKNHRKNIKSKLNFNSRENYSRFLNWVRGFVS